MGGKRPKNAPFGPVPGVFGKPQNGQQAVLGRKVKAKTAQHAVSGGKGKPKTAQHAVPRQKVKAKTAQHPVSGEKVKPKIARHAVSGQKGKRQTSPHRVLRCFGFPFFARHRSFPQLNCAKMAHLIASRCRGRRGDMEMERRQPKGARAAPTRRERLTGVARREGAVRRWCRCGVCLGRGSSPRKGPRSQRRGREAAPPADGPRRRSWLTPRAVGPTRWR